MKISTDLARFGRGFVYAWNGIRAAVKEERNFRFHLCASVYACAAGRLAGLDATGFALLALCIFAMLGMELMNSAGAVMVTALGTICVAVCLFGNPAALTAIWCGVTASPLTVGLWALSLVAAYGFTFRFGNRKEKEENDAANHAE